MIMCDNANCASSHRPDTLSPLWRSWFSADTREERADWMEKLNQVLLDLHTWSRQCDRAETSSITATSQESFL